MLRHQQPLHVQPSRLGPTPGAPSPLLGLEPVAPGAWAAVPLHRLLPVVLASLPPATAAAPYLLHKRLPRVCRVQGMLQPLLLG